MLFNLMGYGHKALNALVDDPGHIRLALLETVHLIRYGIILMYSKSESLGWCAHVSLIHNSTA